MDIYRTYVSKNDEAPNFEIPKKFEKGKIMNKYLVVIGLNDKIALA